MSVPINDSERVNTAAGESGTQQPAREVVSTAAAGGDGAQINRARERVISNESSLTTRLFRNIKLAKLANLVHIAAVLAGICVAQKRCISLLAGALAAMSGLWMDFVASMFSQHNFLASVAMSLLAGIVGSRDCRTFVIGYLLFKMVSVFVECAFQFCSNLARPAETGGLA
ncbi:MAG: hypothetical protein LBS87_00990 [Puniceicoccales bacterium]|jgi:hypothetical protein|nr:hypothetical protein [Puniceicoccales bacterium]